MNFEQWDNRRCTSSSGITAGVRRGSAYKADVELLDILCHDIDDGLLGEAAKELRFYLARKEVKEAFSK